MSFCFVIAATPTADTTASWPRRAVVSAGTVYSVRVTTMPSGKVAEESGREMIVMLKLAAMSAEVIGVPIVPPA